MHGQQNLKQKSVNFGLFEGTISAMDVIYWYRFYT